MFTINIHFLTKNRRNIKKMSVSPKHQLTHQRCMRLLVSISSWVLLSCNLVPMFSIFQFPSASRRKGSLAVSWKKEGGEGLAIIPQKLIMFGPLQDSSVKNVTFMYSLWKQKRNKQQRYKINLPQRH